MRGRRPIRLRGRRPLHRARTPHRSKQPRTRSKELERDACADTGEICCGCCSRKSCSALGRWFQREHIGGTEITIGGALANFELCSCRFRTAVVRTHNLDDVRACLAHEIVCVIPRARPIQVQGKIRGCLCFNRKVKRTLNSEVMQDSVVRERRRRGVAARGVGSGQGQGRGDGQQKRGS